MAKPRSLKGRTAVVTGAASGIGRALALSLARRGCRLALADIDEAGLAQTARNATALGARASCHRLDVADRAAVAAFPAVVAAEHPGVDLLINNAGVALGGDFEELSEADFEWLIDINFWGVVRMTRAFLPVLRRSEDACIVNLSSVFGLIAPPGQTAYSASKFAVRGFSLALGHELKGTNVRVLVVHPGGVATAIARNARFARRMPAEEAARRLRQADRHLRLAPETAGEIIVKAVEQGKTRVLVGRDAKMIAALERMAPVSYWPLMERLVRS
jgi:NAD(P)-dependent dehydrogenase (short-subunit alcohol dehydrogenase family)